MIDYAAYRYPIEFIPAEKRHGILPEHNICSIAPATSSDDDFITGNGSQRIHASGRPYDDEMSFTQER